MARAARKLAYPEWARRFAEGPARPTIAGNLWRKLPPHIKDVLLGIARSGLVLDDTCDWLDREFFELGDPLIAAELRLLESQAEAALAQKAPPASASAPNLISETPASLAGQEAADTANIQARAPASECSDPVPTECAIRVQSVLNRLPPETKMSQKDRRWVAILCEAYPPDGNPERARQEAYDLLQDKTETAFDIQVYDRFIRKMKPAWGED
jgi:hypothetical protein